MKITHQLIDLLPCRDPRRDGAVLCRQQGARVQAKTQFRMGNSEAALDRNDVKARFTGRPREAIDGAGRYTPGPFQQLVRQIPVSVQGIDVRVTGGAGCAAPPAPPPSRRGEAGARSG